jgi:hypothetical protein
MMKGNTGLSIKLGNDNSRVELRCPHRNGLLYAIPSEATWVCSDELRPAHALAGFLGALGQLENQQVQALMQQWGLYFRERPLEPPQWPAEQANQSDG